MMKLFCFPRSGNSREVKIVLAEKGVSFEPIDVHADPAVKQSAEFKKASPRGTVPAIIDGDIYMSEAYKINEYLEDKYPKNSLLPKDPAEREKIRQWVAVYDKRLCLKIGLLLIECLLKPKEQQKEESKQKLRAEIAVGLKDLDQVLAGKEFFFGTYSLADASMTPHLSGMSRVGIEINDQHPYLKAWFERIKSRPSFAASIH